MRRVRLLLALSIALVLSVRAPAVAGSDTRVLWLYAVHTGEQLRVRPFSRHGQLDALDWRRLNWLLRSHRTGKRRTMHPRLLRTLAQVQRHFGGRRIEVVSGYRVAEDADALSSYHQVGRAADVRIAGVDKRALFDYCRQLSASQGLGCGFYPNTTFVHIDVRGRSGLWVDLSRAGRPRRYVANPRAWLRRDR